jgi:hypothetical protein
MININRKKRKSLFKIPPILNLSNRELNKLKAKVQVLVPTLMENKITGIKELTIYYLLIFDNNTYNFH